MTMLAMKMMKTVIIILLMMMMKTLSLMRIEFLLSDNSFINMKQ